MSDNKEAFSSVCSRFSSPDADVVFASSDRTLFRIHQKYLEANTGGFPPAGLSCSNEESIPLEESATTLELLFQFIYPQRHPTLEEIDIAILNPLAEAAEKYEVFSAMNICHIRMRESLRTNGLEVFKYAALHGYTSLLEEAAPLTIQLQLPEVMSIIPVPLIVPWCHYYEEWQKLASSSCRRRADIHTHSYSTCSFWPLAVARIQSELCQVANLRTLNEVFKPAFASQPCCENDMKAWRRDVEAGIKKIPKFGQFI